MIHEYEYIKKSLSDFRKAFPNFIETKKPSGKRFISVFFDFSMLDSITDIPEDIKQNIKIKVSESMDRINALHFGDGIIDKHEGLKYYVDFEGITYNIIDDVKNKRLYSVIKIRGIRFNAYKANIYGYYDGMPVKSNTYKWNANSINTAIYDLLYKEDKTA